jgi:hypothetical protein
MFQRPECCSGFVGCDTVIGCEVPDLLKDVFFFSGCSPRRITMQKDRVYCTDVDDDGGRAERGW